MTNKSSTTDFNNRIPAFHAACISGDLNMVRWLLTRQKGVTPLSLTTKQTGFRKAILHKHKELSTFFLSKVKYNLHIVRAALKTGNLELYQQFKTQGFKSKYHFLLEATYSRNLELLRYVLNETTLNNTKAIVWNNTYKPPRRNYHSNYDAMKVCLWTDQPGSCPVNFLNWCLKYNAKALFELEPYGFDIFTKTIIDTLWDHAFLRQRHYYSGLLTDTEYREEAKEVLTQLLKRDKPEKLELLQSLAAKCPSLCINGIKLLVSNGVTPSEVWQGLLSRIINNFNKEKYPIIIWLQSNYGSDATHPEVFIELVRLGLSWELVFPTAESVLEYVQNYNQAAGYSSSSPEQLNEALVLSLVQGMPNTHLSLLPQSTQELLLKKFKVLQIARLESLAPMESILELA